MYEIRVQAQFYAAHRVRLANRQLEPIHDHDFQVEAVLRGPTLNEDGVLIDFKTVQRALRRIVEPLSDTDLGSALLLAGLNPSSENLARKLFEALSREIGPQAPLAAVYVREAPGCVAGYCGPEKT
jgi:6-pyruvoyltetrahydropterin/6-carboxytetrahydropterin synthase